VVTSGHVTKMAVSQFVSENLLVHANFIALMFYRTGIIADASFTILDSNIKSVTSLNTFRRKLKNLLLSLL